MIITLWIVGYILAGFLTATLGKNVLVTKKYRKAMEDYRTSSYLYSYEEQMERALNRAKKDVEIEVPIIYIVGGGFWPGYLSALVIYLVFRNLTNISFLQSKAEREVGKYKAQQALSAKRKAEWDNALKVMKAAGFDTTELRKLEID